MKIAIIGTGYVGLVTGVSIADLGHNVVCIGRNKEKINDINKGTSPFYEPGLDKILKKLLKKKLIKASDDFANIIKDSQIIIVAVGTPTVKNKIDLSEIKNVSIQIGKGLRDVMGYKVVVVKSTVVPGTTEEVVLPALEKYSNKKIGKDLGLVMNPEFLREGNALEDALTPDRIVIGEWDKKSGTEFAKIYHGKKFPIINTNLKTAEMTKYASNALFATLISYSNEIARISEATNGVDVGEVWKGVHLDKRLSPVVNKKRITPGVVSYITSGCGYGGSCFPKDTKALLNYAGELKVEANIIKSVINVNSSQPHRLVLMLEKALGKNIKNKKIGILGLSFKPNTDDLRESPSIGVINELLVRGVKVIAHDPEVYKIKTPEIFKKLPIKLVKTAKEAVNNSDAVILITSWDEYKNLKPDFFKKLMNNPVLIDGRRIFDRKKFEESGITYFGIGYMGFEKRQ